MALITQGSAHRLHELPLQLWTLPGLISIAALLIWPRRLWQSVWTEPVAGYTIAHTHIIKHSKQPEEWMSPICSFDRSPQIQSRRILTTVWMFYTLLYLIKTEKQIWRFEAHLAEGLIIKVPIFHRWPFPSRRSPMCPFSLEENHE